MPPHDAKGHTYTEMHRYTDTPIHRYTDTHIHRYTNGGLGSSKGGGWQVHARTKVDPTPVIPARQNNHFCNKFLFTSDVSASERLRIEPKTFKKTHEIPNQGSKEKAQRYKSYQNCWILQNICEIALRWSVTGMCKILVKRQVSVIQ